MATLEMMYVYFDNAGDIKTISPDPIAISDDLYSHATVPLSDVVEFLRGKKNPFDYYVKATRGVGGSTYKIIRKQIQEVSHVRTLGNFLTEVKTMPKSTDAFLVIENILKERKIKISLNPGVRELLANGDDRDQEAIQSFINYPSITLFFTRDGDPYFLLHTLVFSPRELFDRSELYWDYTVDLSDSSVYTKKIIDGYSYKVRHGF